MATRPKRFGAQPKAERVRAEDQRRGSARARGYTRTWDKASARHLREHPLCGYCEIGAFGPPRVVAAVLTDHLYPHRAHPDVFWVERLWVSSCTACHSGPKQALEAQGVGAIDRLAHRLGLEPWRGGGV